MSSFAIFRSRRVSFDYGTRSVREPNRVSRHSDRRVSSRTSLTSSRRKDSGISQLVPNTSHLAEGDAACREAKNRSHTRCRRNPGRASRDPKSRPRRRPGRSRPRRSLLNRDIDFALRLDAGNFCSHVKITCGHSGHDHVESVQSRSDHAGKTDRRLHPVEPNGHRGSEG